MLSANKTYICQGWPLFNNNSSIWVYVLRDHIQFKVYNLQIWIGINRYFHYMWFVRLLIVVRNSRINITNFIISNVEDAFFFHYCSILNSFQHSVEILIYLLWGSLLYSVGSNIKLCRRNIEVWSKIICFTLK